MVLTTLGVFWGLQLLGFFGTTERGSSRHSYHVRRTGEPGPVCKPCRECHVVVPATAGDTDQANQMGGRLDCTSLSVASNLWTSALLWGLTRARSDCSQDGMGGNETLETQWQPFDVPSTQIDPAAPASPRWVSWNTCPKTPREPCSCRQHLNVILASSYFSCPHFHLNCAICFPTACTFIEGLHSS